MKTATIWTVFNGEIYNFAEIRAELEAHGHVFRTHTDTEVIVHAYEQWGADAVTRFRGMFAIALWDAPRRRLLLVRDRLGVKPRLLLAAVVGPRLRIGDQGAARGSGRSPRLERRTRSTRISRCSTCPCPQTIYEAVFKLPPAHYLVAEPGRVSDQALLGSAVHRHGRRRRARTSTSNELEALLTEAVKLRLISDVPLGAFLSGGIDSSLVVAAMTKTPTGSRVLTTSVGFSDEAFNELAYARTVADASEDRSRTNTSSNPDIVDLLPKLAWHLDEPFADSSAVPTYYVSKAAREHVTVALSGDGGDELWAGYARHRVEHSELAARRWLGPSGGRLAGWVGAQLPLDDEGRALAATSRARLPPMPTRASTRTACSTTTAQPSSTRATSR